MVAGRAYRGAEAAPTGAGVIEVPEFVIRVRSDL